jgi:hypothetical protein
MTIKAGDIAVCSRGAVGLITEDMPRWVTYKHCGPCSSGFASSPCTCEKGYTFVGVHLTNKTAKVGSPWASRTPRVVGHISSFVPDEFPESDPYHDQGNGTNHRISQCGSHCDDRTD